MLVLSTIYRKCFTGTASWNCVTRCQKIQPPLIILTFPERCSLSFRAASSRASSSTSLRSSMNLRGKRTGTAGQPFIDVALKKAKKGSNGSAPETKKPKKDDKKDDQKDERKDANGSESTEVEENANAKDSSPKKQVSDEVDQSRVRTLKEGEPDKSGPVIYWVSRDQRSRDNWALLHAVQEANKKGVSVAVAFNLLDSYLEAKARHFGFMVRGLRVLEKNLAASNIPFFLFKGKAEETIPAFVADCDASMVVMDFSPLRHGRVWRDAICENVGSSVAVHEVDTHNVVPVWETSEKMEYSARTIRTKIHKLLNRYLVEFPELKSPKASWTAKSPEPIKWDELIEEVTSVGAEVPEVDWCEPGEDAGMDALVGPKDGFITRRLSKYGNRNDPSKPNSLSNLSPYLHFGQLAPQRAALESRRVKKSSPQNIDTFLEELIIRRELSDNFCYYQPNYDNVKGAWDWAKKTLKDHATDKRDHLYTREQLEEGKTHDNLWNAAQMEMVHHGKMHGFMRMYWAKKILEWTPSPEEALSTAIYLNDKYELDGRDPNGYEGCMWSICGIHDQGWRERPVFGKIRYMNYEGCKRKFNTDAYIAQVEKMMKLVKSKKKK